MLIQVLRPIFISIAALIICLTRVVECRAQCEFTTSALDVWLCSNSQDSLSASIVEPDVEYLWQIFYNDVWTGVIDDIPAGVIYSESNEPQLQITNTLVQGTFQYRCATLGVCELLSEEFNVEFRLSPTVSSDQISLCSGESFMFEPMVDIENASLSFVRIPSNAIYQSDDPNEGEGTIFNTLLNLTDGLVDVTYEIHAEFNGCLSEIAILTVELAPRPEVIILQDMYQVCDGAQFVLVPSTNPENATIYYERIETLDYSSPSPSNGTNAINDLLFLEVGDSTEVQYNIWASAYGCSGDTTVITVNLLPVPEIFQQVGEIIVCSGEEFEIDLNTDYPDAETTYSRTNSPLYVSQYPSEGSTSIADNLTNVTSDFFYVIYVIQSELNGCYGTDVNYVVQLTPIPSVSEQIDDYPVCSGTEFIIPLESNNLSSVIAYYRLPSDLYTSEFIAEGSGDINDLLFNETDETLIVEYEVSPQIGSCEGDTISYSINLLPTPIVSTQVDFLSVCSGEEFIIEFTGNLSEINFSYERIESANYESSFPSFGEDQIEDSITNLIQDIIFVNYSVSGEFNECESEPVLFEVVVSPLPVLVIDDYLVAQCEGDLITISLSSPFPQAEISWSRNSDTNILPLSANGTGSIEEDLENISSESQMVEYFIEIDVNGCSGNSNLIQIFIIPGPTPIVSQTDTICLGESTNIFAAGGLYYEWSPAVSLDFPYIQNPLASPQEATTYQVLVSGLNGCANPASVTVNVFEIPTLNFEGELAVCAGETANFSVSGAQSYSWSPIESLGAPNDSNPLAQPLETTTYTVTGFGEGGCLSSLDLMLIVNEVPLILFGPEELCQNSYWSFYSSGTSNLNYQWTIEGGETLTDNEDHSIWVHWTDNSSGIISVQVTDPENGCFKFDDLNVSFLEQVSPDTTEVFELFENMLACADSTQLIYQWGFEDKETLTENLSCFGSQFCLFSELDTEEYYYWVLHGDDSNCLTKSYFIPPITNIETIKNGSRVNVFPNPATDFVTITISDSFLVYSSELVVFDTMGNTLLIKVLDQKTTEIDVSYFAEGIYFLHFDANRGTLPIKLIKL